MNIQRIRERVTKGFKPFVIHLADGRKFAVPHPEFIAVGKNVIVVIEKNDRVNTLTFRSVATTPSVGVPRQSQSLPESPSDSTCGVT